MNSQQEGLVWVGGGRRGVLALSHQVGHLQGTWPRCPTATEALCSSPHHLLSLCPPATPARPASSCLVTGGAGCAPAPEPDARP